MRNLYLAKMNTIELQSMGIICELFSGDFTMLRTFEQARRHTPWEEQGSNVYSYAELLINHSWFYVDCEVSDEGGSVSSVYLIDRAKQLIDIDSHENVLIKVVYLVSPPWLNGSTSWRMDAVKEISSGAVHLDDNDFKVEIYDLMDGNRFYSSNDDQLNKDIEDIKIIFTAKEFN